MKLWKVGGGGDGLFYDSSSKSHGDFFSLVQLALSLSLGRTGAPNLLCFRCLDNPCCQE